MTEPTTHLNDEVTEASNHQRRRFAATAQQIYDALLSSSTFQAITGAPTDIDPKAGGAFSCFGGMITGRTIECSRGKQLVQAWRAKPWEAGRYSTVRMTLTAAGEEAVLDILHVGFPEGQAQHLAQGWDANYWQPLAEYLGS